MTTSVVIPTYNGAHRILNVLRSLEGQTCQPNEVIVVIDGSTDSTSTLLATEPFYINNLRIVEQENKGRAAVRNRGASEASGDLLLFIDDDMIASKTWVEKHLQHHKKFPDTIVTGRLEAYNDKSANDFQKFKIWLHRRWSKSMPVIGSTGHSVLLLTPYITANNFSLPKKIFAALSGFDSRLRDAEDYDLAQRALNIGVPLYFSYDAFSFNNDIDNANCVNYIKRLREYTIAQTILQKIKPEVYKEVHKYATTLPNGIKAKIFSSFCSKWWINSVDKGLWKWMPENIRFRLYDVIITANGVFYPGKVNFM